MSKDTKTFVNPSGYFKQTQGFIIYLTDDARISQCRLPTGLVHDASKKTLESENGSIGRSIGGISGKVSGGPFSIGYHLVKRITTLQDELIWVNDFHR